MQRGEPLRLSAERTVTEALVALIDHQGDGAALEYYGESWTRQELVDTAARVARSLADLGIQPGDRVSVLAHNVPEQLLVFLALARLGAIHAPINPQWLADEANYLLRDNGARALFCTWDTFETARAAVDATAVEHLVVIPRSLEGTAGCPADAADYPNFQDLVGTESLSDDLGAPDAPLCLWYTSGTTGRPKGAVWTHRGFLENTFGWVQAFGMSDVAIGVAAAPIAHNGLAIGVMVPVMSGGRAHLLRRVDPTEMIETILGERVTFMASVPAIMSILSIRAAQLGVDALPSLKVLAIGAAPTPKEQLMELGVFLPNCGIFHSYGASEGHFATCPPAALPGKLGSVGRPLPGRSIQIVDEDWAPVESGTTGRIAVKGAGTMTRYWARDDATESVMRGGWMAIGDLGYLDDDGFLWVSGRDKDVIISGGFNVYASEVENVIASDPRVETVAVLGEADDVLGERVVAYLAPREGQLLTADIIAAICEQRLAKYKRPRSIHVVEALPVNSLGKVQKHLIDRIAEGGDADGDEHVVERKNSP